MKTILISWLLSMLSSLFLTNGNHKDESGFSVKNFDKSVVEISDSLYAGKYEVSNLQFHYWGFDLMKNNDTAMYRIHLPDSLNWRDKLAYNEPFVELYFRHPAYQNYPVVNISYEAAVEYCKWLTDKYNSSPERKFKKVLFRLPTEKEWKMAASCGNEISLYPWGNRLIQNGKYMCNYKTIGDECIKIDSVSKTPVIDQTNNSYGAAGTLNDAADITAPVDSYNPNNYGLYNVCGNVAEMVSEKGIACGGGWKSPGGDVTLDSRATFTRSAVDLGFRYFMQIIEK